MMPTLRDLVRPIPAGEFQVMERAAGEAIEELRAEYRSASCKSIERLQYLVSRPAIGDPNWCDETHRLAHDLKGQGSTFDQELVTILATSLCKLIRAQESTPTPDFQKRANAHCEAIRIIVETDIRGTGGDHGAGLLKILALTA